jgi:hypothetical protein
MEDEDEIFRLLSRMRNGMDVALEEGNRDCLLDTDSTKKVPPGRKRCPGMAKAGLSIHYSPHYKMKVSFRANVEDYHKQKALEHERCVRSRVPSRTLVPSAKPCVV